MSQARAGADADCSADTDSGGGNRLPREVWVLVSASFVIALGYGLVTPALPTFATSFHVGVAAASVVISAFAFMRLAFAPVSGRLVSRWGERPVYLVGLLVVALSTGACAFAQGYWQLLVFRGLGGAGSAMFVVSALSMLIRFTPPEMRGRASSLWSTSFLLGGISGPMVGGLLIVVSIRVPFLAYGAALLIAALVVHKLLHRAEPSGPGTTSEHAPALSVRGALRHGAYRASLLSNFAEGWAMLGVRTALIPLYVTAVLGEPGWLSGIGLSVFAAANAAVLVPGGWLADTRGRKPLALCGLAIAAGGSVWLGLSGSIGTFLVASAVAGTGAGVLNPAHNAAVADVVGARGRGGPALAGFQMASDVGAITGPMLAGALAGAVSYSVAFGTGALVLLGALLLWLTAPETRTRSAAAESAAGSYT